MRKQTQSIYDEMCSSLSKCFEDFENEYSVFHTCVGKLFEKAEKRIVFYGRDHNNGWDEENANNHGIYTVEKYSSIPFFGLINRIANDLFPQNAVDSIAWSNVCKVAPINVEYASERFYDAVIPFARQILRKEIEILSPDVIIFITGITFRWSDVFDLEFPEHKVLETIKCKRDKECNVEAYQCECAGKPILVLVTGRPLEFRSYKALECQYNSIMSLIRKYSVKNEL